LHSSQQVGDGLSVVRREWLRIARLVDLNSSVAIEIL